MKDFYSKHKTFLQIGANAGIVGMTKEHLGLALALSVPVFIVVTKIDMCPPNILQETLKLLVKILKSQGCRKVPVMVRNPDEVVLSATNFVSERLVEDVIVDFLIFFNFLLPDCARFFKCRMSQAKI